MLSLLSVTAAAVLLYVVVYYGVFRAARCSTAARLKGKTAIVTGNDAHLSTPTTASNI